MSRSGLSVQQCADDHRVAMTMRNMGVDEEHFGEFIEKLSSLRIDAGLSPQNLANQIDELCYFREENQSPNGVISIPQIFQTLNTLKAEVSKNLQTIASMESKKSDLESAISSIQHQKAAVEAELNWDIQFKRTIDIVGFPVEKIPLVTDLMMFIKNCGYTIEEIKERIIAHSRLEDACITMKTKVVHLEVNHDNLLKENSNLEDTILKNSQKVRELEFLKDEGIGLSELKLLHCFIDEVEEQGEELGEYRIPRERNAFFKKFLRDLQEHYIDYLNLGKAVNEKRLEIEKLNSECSLVSATLNLAPDVVSFFKSLVKMGFKKDDLECLKKKIEESRLQQHQENSQYSPAKEIPSMAIHSEIQGDMSGSQKQYQ